MHDQLNHLAELAQRENIVIHIITFDSPAGSWYAGPFSEVISASFW
jgi:hypothetical protein